MEGNLHFETTEVSNHPNTEHAKDMLRAAFREYDDDQFNEIIANLKDGALEAIDNVKISTNPEQSRKNMNAWLREWKKEEAE